MSFKNPLILNATWFYPQPGQTRFSTPCRTFRILHDARSPYLELNGFRIRPGHVIVHEKAGVCYAMTEWPEEETDD